MFTCSAPIFAADAPLSFDDDEPVSGIRAIPQELMQAAVPEVEDAALTDELVAAAFHLAIAKSDADVGLLHRRTDAFLFTTDVHALDPGMHMYVGLSFWDPAVQELMRCRTVQGRQGDGEETASIARRLQRGIAPRFVMAVPVIIDDCVEAIIELGRMDAPFHEGTVRSTMTSIHAITA